MSRAYRTLLRLYPSSFRDEYGAELEGVFRARRREASGLEVPWLWVNALADTIVSAAAVHADIARQDVRYASRTMGRSLGFAAAVVAITALGIGANTAVFSLADYALVRPLPFSDPDRLVNLWEDQTYRGYGRVEPSPANFRDWQRAARSFEGMAAYTTLSANMTGAGDPQRLEGAAVTAGLLPLLGVHPAFGRAFTEADDAPGAAGMVLLSDAAWRTLFGGDPEVVGRHITLDGSPYVVVGVMARGFHYPNRQVMFWKTARFDQSAFDDRTNNYLYVVGRLKQGVGVDQAAAEMRVVAAALGRTYKENEHVGVTVRRLRDDVSRQSGLILMVLAGAALCVLLIACTNVANLLIARAATRRAELAVRSALGAGRDRLVRQLLTETLLLSGAGGSLGLLVAAAALPLLARLVPLSLPVAAAPTLDGRTLLIACALTAVTALGFGVWPGLRACRTASADDLKAGARTAGPAGTRLRSALVVVEVTASVVLLAAGGLLLQTLWRVQAIDPGFRADGVVTLRTALPSPKYEPVEARADFYARVTEQIRALPGVRHAAYISGLPMVMRGGIWPVSVDGKPVQPGDRQAVILRFVTPDCFDALGIQVQVGRDVRDSDTLTTPLVAVVSRSFAAQFWPGQNPIGRRLQVAFAEREVVGIANDVRVRGLERESEPQVYLPAAQHNASSVAFYGPKDLVVRASGDPTALLPAIRGIIHRIDPEQPISEVRLLADVLDTESAPRLVQLRVLGVFALLALVMAATGIHAVLSYTVSSRRREIGVRMSLGASRFRILFLIVRNALAVSGTGIALGLLGSIGVGQLLQSLLVGTAPANALALGAAAGLSLTAALAGAALPAWQATRVDPTSAMRGE
jgi:predicted permease